MSKEIYADPWKKFADSWGKFTEGPHPSKKNVTQYKQFLDEAIAGVAEPKVVIFGSTPEVRDMLATYPNIHVTVLDINTEMTKAMSSLMKESHERETWVQGNWLDPQLPKGEFDAVFGDHIRANIPFDKQDELFGAIAGLLKATGALITRIITMFPETKIYTPEELISKYEKIEPSNESTSDFFSELNFLSHRNRESKTDDTIELLKKHIDRPNMKEYYERFLDMLPKGKTWNLGGGSYWEEDRVAIEKYFTIADQLQDDTLFADCSFVYKFVKK